MEKFGVARQATYNTIIRRMRSARWITKGTDTLRIHNKFLLYHNSNGYINAPECYVYRYIVCLVLIKLLVKFKDCLYSENDIS